MNDPYGLDHKIFVSKPKDSFDCPLCFNVLKNPHQCPTGHTFCHGCISMALKSNKTCPICKIYISEQSLSKSLLINNMIEESETVCESKEIKTSVSDCCTWIGPLHSRRAHSEKDCACYEISCPNVGCVMKIERRQLPQHLKECRFVKVTCQWCVDVCQETLFEHELADHRLYSCSRRPVACKNSCGVVVPFNEMGQHISTDCALEIVDCPLAQLGACNQNCPRKMRRCELREHVCGSENLCQTIVNLAKPVVTLRGSVDLAAAQNIELSTCQAALTNKLSALNTTLWVSVHDPEKRTGRVVKSR